VTVKSLLAVHVWLSNDSTVNNLQVQPTDRVSRHPMELALTAS